METMSSALLEEMLLLEEEIEQHPEEYPEIDKYQF